MEMILVQGGTFMMGATPEQTEDCFEDEIPVHEVSLSDFYIGKYPVTQKVWEEIMGDNPSHFKGDDLPVESVSWDDIQEFLVKLNAKTGKVYRLPTEAEWEFAARGGSLSQGFKYAGSNNLDEVAWHADKYTRNPRTHPIGLKKPNELGLYDMSGNVIEWCEDWWGDYLSTAQNNPKGPSSGASNRVYRGGCWNSSAFMCRVSYRSGYKPWYRSGSIGFRLVMSF